MSATSGRSLPPPFAYYDPDTSSWRTYEATLDGDSTLSSLTLPPSGSMRSGALSAQRRSALPTAANGSSSSPLLKTPTAQLAINGGSQHPDKRRAGGHGPTLADEVEHLLPTPTASNPNDGESLESWEARRQRNLTKGIDGNGQGTPLGIAVRLLPTPMARLGDSTSRGADPARYKGPKSLNGRRSNLDDCIAAVETKAPWLGASSSPPSADGKPSSGDQLPGQLTIEDV
jgi:hypothetical protein